MVIALPRTHRRRCRLLANWSGEVSAPIDQISSLRQHRNGRQHPQELAGVVLPFGPWLLATNSPTMAKARDDALGLAPFENVEVVLNGESGVGKKFFAHLIHLNSPRAAGPFKELKLVRMSDGTVESELFGHTRGAFTGARKDRAGLVISAHCGTLFLDEFGHASDAVQRQLLALLEEREIRRLGDDREIPVNVRYVIGTNVHPRMLMEEGKLLPDLFYRLGFCQIDIPPLRERREDIRMLAQYFMDQLAPVMLRRRRVQPTMNRELVWMLEHAPWPGNVRQLRAAVVYMITRVERDGVEELTPRHWPPGLPHPLDDLRSGDREVPLSRAELKRQVQAFSRGGAETEDLMVLARRSRSCIYNWTEGHRPDNRRRAGS